MHDRETISSTLRTVIAQDSTGADLTAGDVVERIGDRGFGLLLMLFSLPSALPIPAPGYSTPFGLIIAVLALQMIAGRKAPWLPRWAARQKIAGKTADRALTASAGFFSRVEKIIRPRMRWISSRAAVPFMGGLVLCMAALMILPIPLTNTFPAFVIFLIGVGLTEEDGLFCLGACALGLMSILLYAGIVTLFVIHGPEGVDRLKEFIKGIFP